MIEKFQTDSTILYLRIISLYLVILKERQDLASLYWDARGLMTLLISSHWKTTVILI